MYKAKMRRWSFEGMADPKREGGKRCGTKMALRPATKYSGARKKAQTRHASPQVVVFSSESMSAGEVHMGSFVYGGGKNHNIFYGH